MSLLRILGILDLAAGSLIILNGFYNLPLQIILASAGYLIIKWLYFFKNLTSLVDAFVGVLAIILALVHWPTLALIAGIHIGLKGAVSLI